MVFPSIRATKVLGDMETVEVKLLQYTFHFRKLTWREEFGIKFEPKENRLRTVLAHALADISGYQIKSIDDAKKVLNQIPTSIISRAFIIYKGSLPNEHRFSTLGLYKAPEAAKYQKKIMESEQEREAVMDRVEQEMASKFGTKELMENRRLENQMLRNSKGRGLTPATPDPVEEKKPETQK